MKAWNFIKNNIYAKNILLAMVIVVALVFVTLWSLGIYTRHGQAVVVPDVKGLNMNAAATFLDSKNLRYIVVDSIYNEHSAPGSIVRTIPETGTKVKEDRIIFLTINTANPPALIIPDVTDQSQRQAMATLNALGFNSVKVEYIPATYKDLVVGLEYKGKQLKPGERIPSNSRLTLLISSGEVEPDSLDIEQDTNDEANSEESWF